MVRAILADQKTETRRPVKPQPNWNHKDEKPEEIMCPYGEPGDILWARETFTGDEWCGFAYRANGTKLPIDCGEISFTKWKPSIFMPRVACRIFLKIKVIRVERLAEITRAGIEAEGFNSPDDFIELWEGLHKKDGMTFFYNPWVWVITFNRTKAP